MAVLALAALAQAAAVTRAAAAQNLLSNPNFDQGIFGWEPLPTTPFPTWDPSRDVGGSPVSGSAALNGDGTAICQCVTHAVTPGTLYEFGGYGLFPTLEEADQFLLFHLTVHPDPFCQVAPIGDFTSSLLGSPMSWLPLRGQFVMPPGFTGAAMRFCGVVQGGGPQVNLDAVYLQAMATGPCAPSATTLCLDHGRFAVTALYQVAPAAPGAAHALPATDGSGFLWFFQSDNLEVSVKIVDGCGLNQHAWFFASGLTNAAVTITVTDTMTGATRTYRNPGGTPFAAIEDTAAFAVCP